MQTARKHKPPGILLWLLLMLLALPAVSGCTPKTTHIAVSPPTATIAVGETSQIIASLLPAEASRHVAWSSSNPAVATVTPAGLVTAVAPGTASIVAATTDGTNLSAISNVSVFATTSVYRGPQRQRLSPEAVTALVRPAVVLVETHRGLGSGFFVHSDGLVLTNAHVARGSRSIAVTTLGGERLPARLIKMDNHSDLALLRVQTLPGRVFPIIQHKVYLDHVAIGEEVLAFGHPAGLAWTVTRGIVGAKRAMSPSFGAWTPDVVLIQHDATIAGGSSGGPIVNLYGAWIGVNALGLGEKEFNFAIPADRYYLLMKQEDYALKDDWFAYITEGYFWDQEWAKIVPIINDAMAATLPHRAALLNRSLPMLAALRREAADYQPLHPEIVHLHRLWLAALDTNTVYNTFVLDVATDRRQWSQALADTLWNNLQRAWAAYRAERGRISARFR